MIYFIADPHFGHTNILKFSNRPFKTIDEHDESLMKAWNHRVGNNDIIYILGDLTMSKDGEYANKLLSKLNGRKILIKGNHESYLNDPKFDKSNYELITDYLTFNYQKTKFVLFHYPILEWDGFFGRSLHLYGHVHNTRLDYFQSTLPRRAINVGVDLFNYAPVSIDELIEHNDPEFKPL